MTLATKTCKERVTGWGKTDEIESGRRANGETDALTPRGVFAHARVEELRQSTLKLTDQLRVLKAGSPSTRLKIHLGGHLLRRCNI